MNIMFLIFSFNTGGIERLLIDMSNEMANRGNNVCLGIINDDYEPDLLGELSDKVSILKLGRKMGEKSYLKYMIQLSREVKERKIEILHCQGINCVLFSAFAKILDRKVKILNTVHDVGNYSSYPWIKIKLQNLFLDKTVAISHVVEKEILSRGQKKEKVQTIYNAIDLSRFSIGSRTFDRNRIILGNVARFFPAKKGQDILVDAVFRLKNENYGYDGIECKFAGAVFKGQESVYKELTERVESNGLSKNITFCGNVNDIPGFLHNIDIFVLPSRFEGFGIALIEALASGVPVVASSIDGPQEIFALAEKDDIYIGELAESGNAQDFAKKMSACVDAGDRWDKQGMRDFVSRHFSMDTMIKKHLELYRSLA